MPDDKIRMMIQPSTDVSQADSDSGDDYGEDGMFRADCIRNVRQYLQKTKGMSAAAAKDFISKRVKIVVSDTCYDDDGVRTVKVRSQITAASKCTGSDVASISLEYDYHHRIRLSSIEHITKFSFSMPTAAGNMFKGTFANLPRAFEDAPQVERRSFTLTQKKAKEIHSDIFGNGWSVLESVLMCYAVAGVHYYDKSADLRSGADTPVCKGGWLEHHTRKVCKALNPDDEGYESESFKKRYEEALAEAEEHAAEMRADRSDDGYGDGYDSYEDEYYGPPKHRGPRDRNDWGGMWGMC